MIIKPIRKHMETQFKGLPKKVLFCKRCVMSNQRPRIKFNKDGICGPCQHTENKKFNLINYKKRHDTLLKLLDKHRKTNGDFDCIVPCSGGKDSSTVAHKLKYQYGMNPLCVTFSPPVYTEIGLTNLRNFIDSGFDHKMVNPNGKVYKLLSKLCFIYFGDHEEAFDRGMFSGPITEAYNNDIKLVFYGENGEVEYGGDQTLANCPGMPWDRFESIYFSSPLEKVIKAGIKDGYFKKYDINLKQAFEKSFTLPNINDLKRKKIEFHWWGFYNKWIPQDNFYYATKHCNFLPNPEGRMEGTYSRYAQLDDATDSLLYYLMYIKYGIGRATSDAAHEIRDGHITREEGLSLVEKYDGEFPEKSFQIFLDYLDITEKEFWLIVDRFRQKHIWKKNGKKWELRHQVFKK
ncbi:N-acetyl sugar amidotransferase [Candidatus Pelagibacter sp.]|nr:N-acetyl sugar amidotransferase [Candidatus Pelagibacter sp.]